MIKQIKILKKNRKFFAALVGNCKCKVAIDDNSAALPLGLQSLDVYDESVTTKYGTDVVFRMAGTVQEQQDSGICTLPSAQFNTWLTKACRELGGAWDSDAQVWAFPAHVEREVDKLDEVYNSELLPYNLTFNTDVSAYSAAVNILGIDVARASDRDSGARLQNGVSLIRGSVTSGGSRKNWATVIGEGTVLRMLLPSLLVARWADDDVTITRYEGDEY